MDTATTTLTNATDLTAGDVLDTGATVTEVTDDNGIVTVFYFTAGGVPRSVEGSRAMKLAKVTA